MFTGVLNNRTVSRPLRQQRQDGRIGDGVERDAGVAERLRNVLPRDETGDFLVEQIAAQHRAFEKYHSRPPSSWSEMYGSRFGLPCDTTPAVLMRGERLQVGRDWGASLRATPRSVPARESLDVVGEVQRRQRFGIIAVDDVAAVILLAQAEQVGCGAAASTGCE